MLQYTAAGPGFSHKHLPQLPQLPWPSRSVFVTLIVHRSRGVVTHTHFPSQPGLLILYCSWDRQGQIKRPTSALNYINIYIYIYKLTKIYSNIIPCSFLFLITWQNISASVEHTALVGGDFCCPPAQLAGGGDPLPAAGNELQPKFWVKGFQPACRVLPFNGLKSGHGIPMMATSSLGASLMEVHHVSCCMPHAMFVGMLSLSLSLDDLGRNSTWLPRIESQTAIGPYIRSNAMRAIK